MRFKIQQFLFFKNHSWSIVGQNIGRALLKLGHSVDFVSTDGINESFLPSDLEVHSRKFPGLDYDCQISYTAPNNWPAYLNSKFGGKRFAIWNYEYNGGELLSGFSRFHNYTDLILPSSNFSKTVFEGMKIPSEKMVVVPHGIFFDKFQHDRKYPLKTKKKVKILLNIAQPHKRKAIHLALEAFGKAFTKADDVCLVAKVFVKNKNDKKDVVFDVSWDELFTTFRRRFPNHAEVEVITSYIDDVSEIYKSCDINFSATHAECWHLPSLEALASGLVNVVPNYGGLLDFCNDKNSLLISGSIVRAPRDHQYWSFNPRAVHFTISTDDAAAKLQHALKNIESLKESMYPHMIETAKKFSWENVGKQIVALTEAK